MMSDAPSIPELAKLMSGGAFITSLAFVMTDSLGKKVDVVELKKKLELRIAALTALVVGAVEAALAPLVDSDLSQIGANVGQDLGAATPGTPPVVMSDAAKDALVIALRKCDDLLAQSRMLRMIPNKVAVLNQRIYWFAVAIALTSSAVFGCCYKWPQMGARQAFALFSAEVTVVVCTAILAISRQKLVSDAEKALIEDDPKA